MVYAVENKFVRLSLDENGNLVELKNLISGHDYAGAMGIWRIIYSHDEVLEEEILPEYSRPDICQINDEKIEMFYDSLATPTGQENISLRIEISIKGDDINFSVDLVNSCATNRIIRELYFPAIRNINIARKQSLYGGSASGADRHVKIDNIAGAIHKHHTSYMADDCSGINMPWFDNGFAIFANNENGLYLGDHDPQFEQTAMLFRKRGDQIDAGIHKSPFLKPGESRSLTGCVISPYAGDWHIGAKKYRRWAEQTWFNPLAKPVSITQDFNGWYRIIMRHQYGKILFRHDEMSRILKSMKETGINTLLMFGWWAEGMDAGYPDYTYDESQGGIHVLKKHIQEFRDNGGRVILYFNARLIDTATDFYKKRGANIAVRGCDGEPLIERYMFSGPGIDLRHQFGYKSFAMACPYSREWMDILRSYVDKALELNVDGVFFDQIGMPEMPCFGVGHGHDIPMTNSRSIRITQMQEIREYIRSKNPEMSFGVECATNFTSSCADYFHSFPGWNIASNNWEESGEKPLLTTFIELFRYTFPEVIISDREIRDDTDIERRVNLALRRGLVSDVEIHRCRSLIDETPFYKTYLTQANKLRNRYRRLILNGHFQDTDGVVCSNPELEWSVFTAGDELAIIVTQSHQSKLTGTFTIPGYELAEHDGLGKYTMKSENGVVEVALFQHGLLVIIFQKMQEHYFAEN